MQKKNWSFFSCWKCHNKNKSYCNVLPKKVSHLAFCIMMNPCGLKLDQSSNPCSGIRCFCKIPICLKDWKILLEKLDKLWEDYLKWHYKWFPRCQQAVTTLGGSDTKYKDKEINKIVSILWIDLLFLRVDEDFWSR